MSYANRVYCFKSHIQRYQQKRKSVLGYQSSGFSNQLIHRPLVDWLRQAIGHQVMNKRIKAIENVGKWGRNSLELEVLQRISSNDPSLELRAAATKAIEQIKTRLSMN